MSEHALLAPSSAARWVPCAGSVRMEQLFPETEESLKQKQGTATHWVASQVLTNQPEPAVGQVAPNGIVIDEEMLEAVDMYVADVQSINGVRHVETLVKMPRIHEHNWGTPDAWIYDEALRSLYVWDFKYGHTFVDAFENWQLIDYVEGILEELGVTGIEDQKITVHMRVVQPRNYHALGPIREWVVKASDLRTYFNVLTSSAAKAFSSDAQCIPNGQCSYCSARHACGALQMSSFKAMDVSAQPIPTSLTNEGLSLELRLINHYLERMEARKSGLEEMAAQIIRSGKTVPGFALQSSLGNAKWAMTPQEVIQIGEMMGVDLAKPGVLTPAQAIKKGLPESLVAGYSVRALGETKLTVADTTGARRVFGAAPL
jgi:hypothetical protein